MIARDIVETESAKAFLRRTSTYRFIGMAGDEMLVYKRDAAWEPVARIARRSLDDRWYIVMLDPGLWVMSAQIELIHGKTFDSKYAAAAWAWRTLVKLGRRHE